MRTTTNRVLWLVLVAAVLQGCAVTQPHSLYSQWQQRAYSAYGMTPPPANAVLFMNTALPPRFLGSPNAAPLQLHQVAARFSAQEERFIHQYYSLR